MPISTTLCRVKSGLCQTLQQRLTLIGALVREHSRCWCPFSQAAVRPNMVNPLCLSFARIPDLMLHPPLLDAHCFLLAWRVMGTTSNWHRSMISTVASESAKRFGEHGRANTQICSLADGCNWNDPVSQDCQFSNSGHVPSSPSCLSGNQHKR